MGGDAFLRPNKNRTSILIDNLTFYLALDGGSEILSSKSTAIAINIAGAGGGGGGGALFQTVCKGYHR